MGWLPWFYKGYCPASVTLTSTILDHSGGARVDLSRGYDHLRLKLSLIPSASLTQLTAVLPNLLDVTSITTPSDPCQPQALPPHPKGDHLIPSKVEA